MRKQLLSILILATLGFTGCSSDDDIKSGGSTGGTQNNINEFIWAAMNSWYLWKDQVPNLSDDIGNASYANLVNNNIPEDLFYKLVYEKNNVDKYSWIIDDYIAQENSFAGVYQSYGFEFGLVRLDVTPNAELFAVVRYVLPGTSAEKNGLKRGDLILTVNGTQLKIDNYRSLFQSSTALFGLASIDLNNIVSLSGKTKTASLEIINENPVFLDTIIDVNGKKAGYLVYNAFTNEYHRELNRAFGRFKAAGIQELILDFRYNGGGSVLTSSYLASMVTDNAPEDIFAKLTFNSKKQGYNDTYFFNNEMLIYEVGNSNYIGTETINKLGLNKVYIIGTYDTASASEMIINGLRPYINVELIGTPTRGKNVGSITLYDTPNTDYVKKENVSPNPDHTYALQPIVFNIFNKNNENDYANGFMPDISVNEYDYLDNLLPLGDPNEPLLNAALKSIDPSFSSRVSSKSHFSKRNISVIKMGSSKDLRPYSEEMYILPNEIEIEAK